MFAEGKIPSFPAGSGVRATLAHQILEIHSSFQQSIPSVSFFIYLKSKGHSAHLGTAVRFAVVNLSLTYTKPKAHK